MINDSNPRDQICRDIEATHSRVRFCSWQLKFLNVTRDAESDIVGGIAQKLIH